MGSEPVIYSEFELETEERRALKEAQYYESLSLSPGWQKLKQYGKSLVDEALRELAANTDPAKDTPLRMRWQQRGYVLDSLIQHVESYVQLKQELIARATEEEN